MVKPSTARWLVLFGAVACAMGLLVTAQDEEPSLSNSTLRRLVTLSRHGSRAPNEVVSKLCPANHANLHSYRVPPEQLTEYGMQQMLLAGQHVRQVYVDEMKFLDSSLNGAHKSHFQSYFRADAATRCAQSAVALGYGLYPDGTGPSGFLREPVPVTMQLLPNEHDFAAPKGPCKRTLQKDLKFYAAARFPTLQMEKQSMLQQLNAICGVNLTQESALPHGEDVVLAIKDVADMVIFDRDQQLTPLPQLNRQISDDLEQLAFQNLMERYYSTDREITYWVGGFADVLLQNLNTLKKDPSKDWLNEDYRYFSYHGHRELLHGLGKMLGWDFDFDGLPKAMGTTSLHPATTLFFELHGVPIQTGAPEEELKKTRQHFQVFPSLTNTSAPVLPKEKYYVRTFIWSPMTPREQVKLSKCSRMDCPLEEFNAIIQNHIAHTGTWQQICGYHAADPTRAQLASRNQHLRDANVALSRGYLVELGLALFVCTVFSIYKTLSLIKSHRSRRDYMAI